jgi:Spy/CpxP family protein refolding chaperone
VRRITAAVVLLAAGLAAPALNAQSIAEGKWWKRPRIARELNLSADQTAQIEKIFAGSKPKLIDLRADFEKKQFDYDQAMQSENPDRKALEAKIEAREQARAALQKELALMELDMKGVLNAAQREKLVEMRERAREALQQRRRRMRDAPPDDFADESDAPPAKRNPRLATPKP